MDNGKREAEEVKKPMDPRVRAVLAVIAAVGLVGAIVGIVLLVRAAIDAIGGYGGNRAVGEVKDEPPIKLTDGRLYFTFNGQNTDITNEVDRDLPYIYPYTDPETSMPAYIIVGGEREQYAYAEVVQQQDGSWRGRGGIPGDNTSYIGVNIDDNIHYPDRPTYANGWYLSNEPLSMVLNYSRTVLNDDGSYEPINHVHFLYNIPQALEIGECGEEWLIRALLELELIQLPYIDFSLTCPIEAAADGRVIFVAEGQETDITDIINEGTPYVYRVKHADEFGEDYDSYILVGGPPANCGWVLLCRSGSDMWIGIEENITFINEALNKGEPGYETFRQWYLNGVEQIGYNKGVIFQNRGRERADG